MIWNKKAEYLFPAFICRMVLNYNLNPRSYWNLQEAC